MAQPPIGPGSRTQPVVQDLRVSGQLMTLEPGLYCVIQTPSPGADIRAGMPGVRISPAPGMAARPDGVTILGFRPDGFLSGTGDAALVRVQGGSGQIVVTVYQAPGTDGVAPQVQVVRLLDAPAGLPAGADPAAPLARPRTARPVDMLAHIQTRGDVGAMLGEWLGERGSGHWIEGFVVSPREAIGVQDIEYQGVLGRGWLSPWTEGGEFCGSRGMALPLLGLRVRLRGAMNETHMCEVSASFTDGSSAGPVLDGAACEADSLAPMEAFQIRILPREAVVAEKPQKPRPRRG